MKYEQTPEGLDEARIDFERQEQKAEKPGYTPRPRWHLVMAWVLLGIVVLGIINICWMQITA